MLVVLGSILILRLPAFLALILGTIIVGILTPLSSLEVYAVSKGMSADALSKFLNEPLGKRIATAFGSTCGKVGILIAMASIIGSSLAKSGAADRIIRSTLKLFGIKGAPAAFLISSFTLGIPVFFDTVFYLMVPLARSISLRHSGKYVLYILAIVAGAAMAHSLIPPTPGPLFVAGELGVDIGAMILGGLVVGLFAAGAGYIYALWSHKKWPVPLRETPDTPLAELKGNMEKDINQLPSLWIALLPVILPVLLIAGQTISNSLVQNPEALDGISNLAFRSLAFLGNSNIALSISAAISLYVLYLYLKAQRKQFNQIIQASLSTAGLIILIIGAGGAFGNILQQTGVGIRIQELATQYQIAILPLAFGVTALVRMAQGSATVAMITAVGILSAMGESAVLGFNPLYLALAIGCGSKPFLWMNDSGFWVVSKMSGMTESEALKHVSVLMTVMGFAGIIVVMILAKLFPLVG